MTAADPGPQQPEAILDASALLAYLSAEPGGDATEAVLNRSAISTINWSEVLQKSLAQGHSVENRREDLEALGLLIYPFTAEDAEAAALLWSQTRQVGLSLADRACLALAQRLGVPVLTADRAWGNLDVAVTVRVIR